jgi:flagellar hook-length control protein FliK
MEQAIPAASGGNAQSKALESAGLFKMTGASSDKIKVTNTQSGKDEEDSNAVVPFLHLLNQQRSRTDKSSDDDASNINEKNITSEQATLLLQCDVTLKELQQALAGLTQLGETAEIDQAKNGQTEISFDVLLKEIDLLTNNLASGDIKTESDANPDAIFSLLDIELKAMTSDSENEQKIMNDQNVILNQPGGITLGEGENKLFSKDESSEIDQIKIAGMDLKNVNGTGSDEAKANNINLQSQLENLSAEEEVKFKGQGMEKPSVLKANEKTLQPEKMVIQEVQLSESAANKIPVNLTEIKKENKTGNDILSAGSGAEDSAAGNNSRLITQEMKESQIGKDNLPFSKEQYSNAANAKAENKAQADAMQTIMGEVSGKIKAEQKGKTVSGEKGNEEILLTGVNATGSGQASTEKINAVSADKIIGQVTSEIKEAATNDGGRVKITLNPPSLGKLEMDVTVRNGKVEVVLVADNKDVQQILNAHIDKLKGSLQNQGLTIDRCDVFMQDKREEYQQSFSQQAFNHQDRSGQDSNTRQENSDEEVKVSARAIISEQPGSVLSVSTDNISLFA